MGDVAIKSPKVKELYEMYQALKSTKESYDSQKAECEKYNNQDEFAKYGKMQRALVKMSKLIKTNEEEIQSRQAALALSEREEYSNLISGKAPTSKKPIQESAPTPEAPKSMINQNQLAFLIFFYLVFYILPLFILPLFFDTSRDYLVSSEMFIQPFNPKIKGYQPQMPSSMTINRYASEAEQGVMGQVVGYFFDSITARLFVFMENGGEIVTFIKLRPAYVIANAAARKILNK